jgi:hypothetical protein
MNKLEEFLDAATPDEVYRCAEAAGTTPTYLVQLAKQYGAGRTPSVKLAHLFEKATRELHRTRRRVPVVTVKDLFELSSKG